MSSPFFEQEKLIIVGNKNLSYEAICEIIGFKAKTNVFLFDFFNSKKKIIEKQFCGESQFKIYISK